MKWSDEAEAAMRKVPFFVRKRARARVEAHAAQKGRKTVKLDDVHEVKQGYLENMEKEVLGYRIESCFGPQGCRNRCTHDEDLPALLESLLAGKNLLDFLKNTVEGPLKFHHEFCVALADCPNACSRPQIKDIGIIGAAVPEVTGETCSMCGQCVGVCKEGAIRIDETRQMPEIDRIKCLDCGQCAEVCPTETLRVSRRAYKILLGGKLGRHPRLAEPLPGCYDKEKVFDIVSRCVDFYVQHSRDGKRFAQLYAESRDALMEELAGYLRQT
ncbi:MAG: 4Fe-4S binding protein [Desulfobacterales bacterium]|nr:4Fe-4S binding protein [Desulfobacterales bacterium]